MQINFTFFNFSSIKFEKRLLRYSSIGLRFDNHFCDIEIAKQVILNCKEKLKLCKNFSSNDLKLKVENGEFKHWAIKQGNSQIEPTLLVLQKYGFSRDFVITKIFDGYLSENLKTENPVLEKFSSSGYVLKMDISIHSKSRVSKERLICFVKNEVIFPLFVDVNHSLYHESSNNVFSNKDIEMLFCNILMTFSYS